MARQGLGLLFTALGGEGFVDFLAVLAPVGPNLDADVFRLSQQRVKLWRFAWRVSALLLLITGYLIGTLITGTLICRKFFRPSSDFFPTLFGYFSDLARRFFRGRSDFFPTLKRLRGRIFFRPVQLAIPLFGLFGQTKQTDVGSVG
ncbi:hypothetical protein D3C87_1522290 [compost metagenome]